MPEVTGFVRIFVDYLFTALTFAIIARALLSWFNPAPGNRIAIMLEEITEPIIAPIRRIVPRIGMIDISPIVAIFALQIVQTLLLGALAGY
ncbi:MAG: YggT family protein [Chloroflexota bacterium]